MSRSANAMPFAVRATALARGVECAVPTEWPAGVCHPERGTAARGRLRQGRRTCGAYPGVGPVGENPCSSSRLRYRNGTDRVAVGDPGFTARPQKAHDRAAGTAPTSGNGRRAPSRG